MCSKATILTRLGIHSKSTVFTVKPKRILKLAPATHRELHAFIPWAKTRYNDVNITKVLKH